MSQSVLIIFFFFSVSAFAMSKASIRNQMSMKVDLVGSSAPLGFFDPLGFSKTDVATLKKYRESELKHGRVAMLAVLGWLTQERFHPLYDGKLSGNPLKAFLEVPPLGFVQIIVLGGVLEYVFNEVAKGQGDDYVPGDFYGITARIPKADDASWVDFQTRELNNGRLAMFAILGEITHAALTGKGAFEMMGI